MKGGSAGVVGAATLPLSELARIKSSLYVETIKPAQTRARELHEKSKARANTWTNTLQGGRRRKAMERQEKEEIEEQARRKVDEEEAQYLLEQRKATIQRANAILFDESDRLKTFHGKMMLCDVLAEREAQIDLKDELNKLELIREERYLEMDRQNYRKMLDRELNEKKQLEELKDITETVQKHQRAQKAKRFADQAEFARQEGILIRQKAADDLEAEKLLEQKKRQQRLMALKEMDKSNQYKKSIQAEDLLRVQKESEKTQEYAVKKQRMLDLRKEHEMKLFTEKQRVKQRMIDKQTELLSLLKSNEETRIENQVKDTEAKNEKKRLEKEGELEQLRQEIDVSRRQQIAQKKDARERELATDMEISRFWSEWCKKLEEDDKTDILARRRTNGALARDQLKQVEMRRRREKEESRMEAKVVARAKLVGDNDSIEFHNYAEKVIREYALDGKNVIPLVKELRDYQKRGLE